jgi:lysozyme
MTQDTTTRSFKLIAGFEGLSLTPYLCAAGKWTIGWGNTRLPDGSFVTSDTPPITREQADLMLTREIMSVEDALLRLVKVPLSENQATALTSFVYNVGATAFENSTLLKKLNAGDYGGAADEFPQWVHANGKILGGLIKRREKERALFLSE